LLPGSINAQVPLGGGLERKEVTTMGRMSQDVVGNFEVVHVIGKGRLIDAESYERTIWARDGGSLPLGFYVVCWSVAGLQGTYDEDAMFRGPFQRREDAWAVVEQLREQTSARRLTTMPAGWPGTVTADGDRGAPLE
jgi:hypothetical protein